MKVVEVLFAGTVTELGTVAAAVILLWRETEAPPVGASPLRITVPVAPAPPTTVVGLSESDVNTEGATPPP